MAHNKNTVKTNTRSTEGNIPTHINTALYYPLVGDLLFTCTAVMLYCYTAVLPVTCLRDKDIKLKLKYIKNIY